MALSAPLRSARGDQAPIAASGDQTQTLLRSAVALRSLGGQSLGQGIVLENDGRIVTAASVVGIETMINVRYPNGRIAPASVVARDPRWNLALLQPRTNRWYSGLALAVSTRQETTARWSVGDPPGATFSRFSRRRTFVAPDGALLRDAWEFTVAPASQGYGSAVINERGMLAAIVVPGFTAAQAINNATPRTAFGAPASAVAALLASAGDTARPYIGFTARALRPDETAPLGYGGGLRVLEVAPGGPAAAVALQGGATADIVVMADGQPTRVVEELSRALERRHANDTIVLRIARGTQLYDVTFNLGRYPTFGP